jgi:hypothetical protein
MAINRNSAQRVLCIATIAALFLASGAVNAQRSSELSADLPDTRTMAVQDKVDKLFNDGDFKRSFFIYRNELAPLGDKFAHYMVGYMYQNGMGVEQDWITASAWYRLAAERGNRQFIVIRDRALRKLDDSETRESDAQYQRLRASYCDLAVLLSSIKRDHEELKGRTGSRLQGGSSPLTVINAARGTTRSGTEYYGQIRRQLEFRVKLLVELGEFENVETDIEKINIRDIERQVRERIESSD